MMKQSKSGDPAHDARELALDEALEETFPASDPPAATTPRPHPYRDPADEDLREP